MLFPRYVWLTYSDESGGLSTSGKLQCDGRVYTESVDGLFTLKSVSVDANVSSYRYS